MSNHNVIIRYLTTTDEDAMHFFQRMYPTDWRFFYDHWKNNGIEPNRAKAYCEMELSKMVIAKLRERPPTAMAK